MNIDNTDELLVLLSKRIEKYTSKESTSVPYSIARQLMNSILYCIDLARENASTQMPINQLHSDNSFTVSTTRSTVTEVGLKDLYQNGLEKVKNMTLETKAYFKEIESNFNSYRNTCYYDTVIGGMPAFFLHYNPDFDARNTILTLDYPLLTAESSKGGIIQIKDYLSYIKLEQLFLSNYPTNMVESILAAYDKNYTELIFNLCIPILNNALACMLINRPLLPLYISEEERKELEKIGTNHTPSQLKDLLEHELSLLIHEYYHDNTNLYHYLMSRINSMVAEFKLSCEHHCLDRMFYDTPSSSIENSIQYKDGSSMNDEVLRDLINEMQDMRHLSDKLQLITENVKSLSDLKEFLSTCFFQGEYESVFQLLNSTECNILKNEISEKLLFDHELYEWEQALLEYLE